ncbi:hypothetical protein KRX51_07085 [Corynebacterium sp. TAE3-ERU12]|uniref:hypothetical protein n=1 Tax=Corynebacterium sp. TAE3-ERU12 TaxID=2849491 RepID=UPI001C46350A|nr:hypothetical protein [Corynebacterium sp. TAE3-ERU12]MBV7295678.1 hypothetical protein [Corynebacterium sp. TAE3-ERU12]
MIFQPDNSRTNRAAQAEHRARTLVQEILDREERVRANLASEHVDPWRMRFILDSSISSGPIAGWREESVRARRLLRRFSIQAGYRERMRDVERRIDALLHLAEHLEEQWDMAAAASARLSDAEAHSAAELAKEQRRQNNAPTERPPSRLMERLASSAMNRAVDMGRDALERLPDLLDRSSKSSNNEVRRAEARDLRKQPPLPED